MFCSLASGSSGNCYYVGKHDEGILVDAGISASIIESRLKKIDIPISKIKAIFVTHDHIDHIKGLEHLANHNRIPVYAHTDCLCGIAESKFSKGTDKNLFREIVPMETYEVSGIKIEPFPVLHDGHGTVGYRFSYDGSSLTIATDVGTLDHVVKDFLRKSESIVLESNYDPRMLADGPYPYVLKHRIAGPFGHLSNDEASRYVAEVYGEGMKNIMLCHLSEKNNTPEAVMLSIYKCLRKNHVAVNAGVSMFPLPRYKQTELIYL